MTQPLAVAPTLRHTARIWWRDFAPITLLGIAILIGTELVLHVTGAAASAAESTKTLVLTARIFAALLFASAVSGATLAAGHAGRLRPRTYMLGGLKLAQPGLVTALTIAAALFTLLIAELLLSLFLGGAAALLTIPAFIYLAVIWLPAIPAAIAEKRPPFLALKRSAALTRGRRWRLLALLGAAVLLLLPPSLLPYLVLLGGGATDESAARELVTELTPTSAGFWILQLTNVLLTGLVAVLPPVVYRALTADTQRIFEK